MQSPLSTESEAVETIRYSSSYSSAIQTRPLSRPKPKRASNKTFDTAPSKRIPVHRTLFAALAQISMLELTKCKIVNISAAVSHPKCTQNRIRLQARHLLTWPFANAGHRLSSRLPYNLLTFLLFVNYHPVFCPSG